MNLLKKLPFYPPKPTKRASAFDVAELLRGGYTKQKLPLDGIIDIHAIRFATSDAKAMAKVFKDTLGFTEIAYRGLETGSIVVASHVLQKDECVFEVMNTLGKGTSRPTSRAESDQTVFSKFEESPMTVRVRGGGTSFKHLKAFGEQLAYESQQAIDIDRFVGAHGMGVMDVAVLVADAEAAFEKAVAAGAVPLRLPVVVEDSQGSVVLAVVGVPGSDLRHTLVQSLSYSGVYLPLYAASEPSTTQKGPEVPIFRVDHVVQNFTWNEMMVYARFYALAFGLHKFWSVDEQDVSTGATALKLIVMTSSNGRVKMPINEPAKGIMKGQIEEFYEFYKGPGVQHIALRTRNILKLVKGMRLRGVDFNTISDAYYENLAARLAKDSIDLFESFDELKEQHILVDFDPLSKYKYREGRFRCHYILQIFTKPLHDKPTLFLEVIQRHHHDGFGKGTFKGLFETIEAQQRLRGTLVPSSLM